MRQDFVKTKHHYVWKNYLRPWSENGQIWTKREGKTFLTSLENVGQKRFFYEVFALTNAEIKILNAFIQGTHPSAHPTLFDTFKMFLDITYGDEEKRKTGLEDYHAHTEGYTVKVLNCIYERNFDFLKFEHLRNNFCYFVGLQFMRTRRQFEQLSLVMRRFDLIEDYREYMNDINIKSIVKAFQFIMADITGNWLSQAKIKFIQTVGDETLITCDQPVINTSSDPLHRETPATEMNLLYPLTPTLAMLASDKDIPYEGLNTLQVKNFNQLLKNYSFEQTYAISEKALLE